MAHAHDTHFTDAAALRALTVAAADVISAVEFDADGSYLATGDKGGRVVLFEKVSTLPVSTWAAWSALLGVAGSRAAGTAASLCSPVLAAAPALLWREHARCAQQALGLALQRCSLLQASAL